MLTQFFDVVWWFPVRAATLQSLQVWSHSQCICLSLHFLISFYFQFWDLLSMILVSRWALCFKCSCIDITFHVFRAKCLLDLIRQFTPKLYQTNALRVKFSTLLGSPPPTHTHHTHSPWVALGPFWIPMGSCWHPFNSIWNVSPSLLAPFRFSVGICLEYFVVRGAEICKWKRKRKRYRKRKRARR